MIEIIIPAHNCKDKIKRALGSLVSQNAKNFIVTVVDDCSDADQDLTPIINFFKQILPLNYIRLNKNLKYPGLVRQVGIDNSISDYIMFMDDDDMMLPYAVDQLYEVAKRSKADMVIGAFLSESKSKELTKKGQNDTTWLHGNLYRLKALRDYNIRFSPYYNEDGGFNTQCYLLLDNIVYYDNPVYFWSYNKDSITRTDPYWILHNCTHIVDSLIPAYENVMQHYTEQKKNKILHSFANHLAFFYNIYNAIITLTPEDTTSIELLEKSIQVFVNTFDLNGYFKILEFQGDFLNSISSYNILPIQTKEITIKEFFEKLHIDYEIDMKKLIRVVK